MAKLLSGSAGGTQRSSAQKKVDAVEIGIPARVLDDALVERLGNPAAGQCDTEKGFGRSLAQKFCKFICGELGERGRVGEVNRFHAGESFLR